MKKLTALLLAALLILSLAGCSQNSSGDSGTSGTANAPSTSTDSAGSGSASTSTDSADLASGSFTGYPMAKKDTRITWAVYEGYQLNSSYANGDQSPFHSGLAEMLGVTIDWQFVPVGGNGQQEFNMMIASGDWPDVIFKGDIIKDAARYINEGVLRDLTPYIQEYSPAYYAWLQTNENYDKTMKTDEGMYFGYGFFREDGGWNDTYLGPVIRQDWLDECGLPTPVTIADWDTVLRAFKDKYGTTLSFANSRFNSTGISGAFGAYTSINFKVYIDDNKKIQLAHIQPEWRDYMAKLNEWWNEGLLDQDFLTIDDTTARSNALNGKMGISITSMGQLSNWDGDAEGAGNGAKWVGLQYPTSNDGKLSMVFGGYGIGNMAAVISTNCSDDKLETVMRALDYAYTEEGNLYWNFGKQGVSWDYDADGNPEFLPLVKDDPDGLNSAIDKYGGSTWSGNCIQATRLLYMKNKPVAVAANDLWFYPNQAVTSKWALPSGVAFTADESNTIADIRSAMDTYMSEMAANYITGAESLANFDTFVANVKNMRSDELLAIYQAAYDRYLAR